MKRRSFIQKLLMLPVVAAILSKVAKAAKPFPWSDLPKAKPILGKYFREKNYCGVAYAPLENQPISGAPLSDGPISNEEIPNFKIVHRSDCPTHKGFPCDQIFEPTEKQLEIMMNSGGYFKIPKLKRL